MIPQCNPLAGYMANKKKIDAAVSRVLESGLYILGQEVEAFEREFAEWLNVPHSVGVANGTDAIELALRASGICAGDAVATVSHTAVATVSAISRCGARPVFVDIEPDFFTMDAYSLEDVVSSVKGVKAVVAVHLYGQMADMPAILDIASRYGLAVVEDCAQAHGAVMDGKQAGTWGDFGCFSFYPTKNLGAFGDGGAVVTKDAAMKDRLLALRQYGWDSRRLSRIEGGVNSRLDELQAAVLRERLKCLSGDNDARRRIAASYYSGLEGCASIVLPSVRCGCEHVYHQFVVRCRMRKTLIEAMGQAKIGCAVHYPSPVHGQSVYACEQFSPVPLLNTELVSPSILSLPMFPQLTVPEVNRVVEWFKQSGFFDVFRKQKNDQ